MRFGAVVVTSTPRLCPVSAPLLQFLGSCFLKRFFFRMVERFLVAFSSEGLCNVVEGGYSVFLQFQCSLSGCMHDFIMLSRHSRWYSTRRKPYQGRRYVALAFHSYHPHAK